MEAFQHHCGFAKRSACAMSINLSIKNVPESLADALRARAESHHRSLQGELMSILEAAVGPGMTAQQTLAEYSLDPVAVKVARGKAEAKAKAKAKARSSAAALLSASSSPQAASTAGMLSLQQLWQRSSAVARKARVKTVDESAAMIREDRDRR
jgi:plasmid stability protein